MRMILLCLVSLLAACSTAIPLTRDFPDAPDIMMEKCPELRTIQGERVSIVEFTKTVSENYTTYYQCAAKQEAWIDWYQKQKQIWDETK